MGQGPEGQGGGGRIPELISTNEKPKKTGPLSPAGGESRIVHHSFVLGLVCLMNSLSLLAKILKNKIPLDTQYAERVLLCLYEFSRILCLHTALHATHDSCVRYV